MFRYVGSSSLFKRLVLDTTFNRIIIDQPNQLRITHFEPNVYFVGRSVCTTNVQRTASEQSPLENDIQVNYISKNGEKVTVYGKDGDNLMYLAHKHSVDIEGACEASLACCTCHVYVRNDYLSKLKPATEEEEDLLDMAPFLKSNSRLSCQIILSKDINGLEVTLPPATRNFYVDDKKPSHH